MAWLKQKTLVELILRFFWCKTKGNKDNYTKRYSSLNFEATKLLLLHQSWMNVIIALNLEDSEKNVTSNLP